MKSGTLTVLPVSSIAGLVTLLAVSPRKPFRRFDHFEIHRCRQLHLDGLALGVKNLDRKIFDEIILRIAEQILLQRDRLVGLRIHEMVSAVVLVTELERASG